MEKKVHLTRSPLPVPLALTQEGVWLAPYSKKLMVQYLADIFIHSDPGHPTLRAVALTTVTANTHN